MDAGEMNHEMALRGEIDVSVGTNPIDAFLAEEGVVATDQTTLATDQATLSTDDANAYAAVTAAGSPCVHLVYAGTPPTVTAAYLCTAVPPATGTGTGTVTIVGITLI